MAAMVLLWAGSAQAQKAAPPADPPPAAEPIKVLRVIDDPSTGVRWLLVRDSDHPGGPGRMVVSSENASGARGISATATARGLISPGPAAFDPVIRIGDRLIVEEHTAVADASLEAVALSAANLGAPLDVRLRIGGKRLRALATGPGHATLQALEVRP